MCFRFYAILVYVDIGSVDKFRFTVRVFHWHTNDECWLL